MTSFSGRGREGRDLQGNSSGSINTKLTVGAGNDVSGFGDNTQTTAGRFGDLVGAAA